MRPVDEKILFVVLGFEGLGCLRLPGLSGDPQQDLEDA